MIEPSEFDPETKNLIDWLKQLPVNQLPMIEFELSQGAKVIEPLEWYRSLREDIRLGPKNTRAKRGLLALDIKRLKNIIEGGNSKNEKS